MQMHRTQREQVAAAIASIKENQSHDERLEAYLVLNAEINARILDSIESVLDILDSTVQNDVVKVRAVGP
jgi:hypothetical protein